MSSVTGSELFAEVEKIGAELGASVHYKQESLLMKVIAAILFFNKRFMTSYTTTIGRRIYFCRRYSSDVEFFRGTRTLAHELVHVEDYNTKPIRFTLSYLFPQILAVFSLVAVGAIWHFSLLWFLVFLVALLPFPAYWRMKAEVRGYTMTMAVDWWMGYRNDINYESFFSTFTGAGYYFMWPLKSSLRRHFSSYVELLARGRLHREIPVAFKIKEAIDRSVC